MNALLTSRSWGWRVTRIALLTGALWWALQNIVYAQFPDEWAWPNTNFEKSLIDPGEIRSGGPPKDGIPPVDNPEFDDVASANEWLDPREPVIVVSVGDQTKAYPLQILTWHEIVNDTVGDIPVSVTFCPLCNASIVFDRRIDGTVYDFGTTGKLRKSDLVMYDRQTESWWQQLTGRAIVGDLSGTVLDRVPASIVAYDDFRLAYPDAPVLSRRTGHPRSYGRNPYRGYDSIDDQPFLFSDPVDERLPPMERVLNVTVGSQHKLYPFTALRTEPVVNDEVAGVPVAVFSREGTLSVLDAGEITESRTIPSATAYDRRLDDRSLTFELRDTRIVDVETGSQWNLFGESTNGALAGRTLRTVNSGVHFAFAWLAFNPASEIYRP